MPSGIYVTTGGEGEIRTHERREALPVFKTGAFNRSATSPLTPELSTCGAFCLTNKLAAIVARS
jgi:hypothetical protein